MCYGELIAGVGALLTAGAAVERGKDAQFMADQEAANERDRAKAEADIIRRARDRQVSAARAATAASGTTLDEFSMINTNEIQQLGSEDAAMTILSGDRRGRALEYAGESAYQAAKYEAIGGLMSYGGAAYANWKGKKK